MLGVDEAAQVVGAVEDAAAEAEAAWPGALVPPVAEGGDGGAQKFGCFGDGEQFGFAVAEGLVMAGSVWTAGGAPWIVLSLGEGAFLGRLLTAHRHKGAESLR